MSNSPKNTIIKGSGAEKVKSDDAITASNALNHVEKRPGTEDANVEKKKIKIETSTLEQIASMTAATNITASGFVSASTMVVSVPDISDEELLKYTLDFERTHDIK